MGWPLLSGKLPLVNQRTEPTPTNVRQPGERVMRSPLIAEIDDERATLHRAHVDKSPVARILGIVPVVAQPEILVHPHPKRAPGTARRMIAAALSDGSFGYANTITSPRRGVLKPGSRALVPGICAPYTALLTNRKSPTNSVRSMLPEGI